MIEMTSQSNECTAKLEKQKLEFECQSRRVAQDVIKLERLLEASTESNLRQQDANKVLQEGLKTLEATIESLKGELVLKDMKEKELVAKFQGELEVLELKLCEENRNMSTMKFSMSLMEKQLIEQDEQVGSDRVFWEAEISIKFRMFKFRLKKLVIEGLRLM